MSTQCAATGMEKPCSASAALPSASVSCVAARTTPDLTIVLEDWSYDPDCCSVAQANAQTSGSAAATAGAKDCAWSPSRSMSSESTAMAVIFDAPSSVRSSSESTAPSISGA